MYINNTEIPLGQSLRVEVNIAKLPSRTPIDLIVTVARSPEPGPTLLLMGGVHGDEINGIEIVRRIIENGHHIPVKGTVVCIPIVNIYGFIHFSRYVPDGKDVNRSFPGNKNGSLASRIAYYLMKDIVPKIDYGIDFHTGGADRKNYPQLRCLLTDPVNRELAKAFHAPFTIHSTHRPKSLRQSAARLGKRILVFEGGESARFSERAISHGIDGTLRVMKHLGMLNGQAPEPDYNNQQFMHSTWVRARSSGMFQSFVSGGDEIRKSQVVGYITDPFADYKVEVKSHAPGFVISINNNPIVHQGDALMHIGVLR